MRLTFSSGDHHAGLDVLGIAPLALGDAGLFAQPVAIGRRPIPGNVDRGACRLVAIARLIAVAGIERLVLLKVTSFVATQSERSILR